MKRHGALRWLKELTLLAVALIFFSPLLIGLNLSFRETGDTSSVFALTVRPTLANYETAWTEANLGAAFGVSVFVTVLSVLGILAIASAAAYPLARSTARWSRLMFLFFLVGLLLPFLLALLPLYKSMRDLGLLGTPWSVILFNIGVQLPINIFVLTGFLRTIPVDYDEAALLDGANPLRVFVSVILPLLRPALGTVAIFSTIFAWNDFMTPLLFLSGSESRTLPIAIYTFVGQYTSRWNIFFAGLFLTIAPLVVMFLALQRYVISGFAGGLKG